MATTPGLRPLGLGEILDVGIKLYLRHWRVLMACVVWVVLPLQIVSVLFTLSVAPEQLDITSTETADPVEDDAVFASQLVILVLALLVFTLSTAACFKAVADAYLGTEPSARRSLAFALRRLPALIWLGIVATIGVVLALFAFVLPSIWLAVAWSLAVPALLFERVGAFGALRRSFRLVRGRWWMIFLTLLIGVVLVWFLSLILQVVLLVVPAVLSDGNEAVNAFSTVVAGTIGSVLTTPFPAAIVTLLYFDQRIRKEGFDLQLLAEGLGTEVAADAGPEQREPVPAPSRPPPAGWKPPEAAGQPAEPVPRPATEPEPRPPEEPDEPGEGGWRPPRAPSWPPDAPPRGPGGL